VSVKKISARKTSTRKLSAKKIAARKAPTRSATEFSIGTQRKGNDGNQWIVKKVGKSQRWIKVSKKKQEDDEPKHKAPTPENKSYQEKYFPHVNLHTPGKAY